MKSKQSRVSLLIIVLALALQLCAVVAQARAGQNSNTSMTTTTTTTTTTSGRRRMNPCRTRCLRGYRLCLSGIVNPVNCRAKYRACLRRCWR